MDARETARYLSRLYDEGQAFEVGYLAKDKPPARKTRTYSTDLLDEMERAEKAGYNVYTSVLPCDAQDSGSYDRVWLDQDDPAAPYPFGADPRWGEAAWPSPTTLVKTSDAEGGFRYQAIWKLTQPLPAEEAKTLMRGLAKQVGADTAVFDSRRLLRVPGILNAKRGTYARIISTCAAPINPSSFDLPTENLIQKLLTTPVSSPSHILGEWLDGTDEGDRSRKAYVCARFLKSCGVAWSDAGAIMKVGASRCNPAFPDDELEHVLNSAFHRN